MAFRHMVITPQWVAWGPCGGMGWHGGCIFDHKPQVGGGLAESLRLTVGRVILAPVIQTNIRNDDVLLHEMENVIVILLLLLIQLPSHFGAVLGLLGYEF